MMTVDRVALAADGLIYAGSMVILGAARRVVPVPVLAVTPGRPPKMKFCERIATRASDRRRLAGYCRASLCVAIKHRCLS
jgi:hypothetical protein